jgi:hypothetical protein
MFWRPNGAKWPEGSARCVKQRATQMSEGATRRSITMTSSSSPTTKEKELKRNLQIVKDVYAGHFDEYFEQHDNEQELRKLLGDKAVDEIIAILENRDDHNNND